MACKGFIDVQGAHQARPSSRDSRRTNRYCCVSHMAANPDLTRQSAVSPTPCSSEAIGSICPLGVDEEQKGFYVLDQKIKKQLPDTQVNIACLTAVFFLIVCVATLPITFRRYFGANP